MVIKLYKPTAVDVVDELISFKTGRLFEFCERIKPYNILWSVQMRVDIVTKEILQKMRDCGYYSISYGLESFRQPVLSNMRKHITPSQIEYALRLTFEVGIDI